MTNPYRLSRSRRNILKMGTIGSIFLLCGGTLQKAAQSQQGAGLEPFKRLLPIPPTLKPVRSDATTDYYEITLRKQFSEIIPGTRTEIWGYNGIAPGPTIRQRGSINSKERRKSVVRFINKLGNDDRGKLIPTVVHLHGLSSPPQYDGYTMDLIPPESFKDYEYLNDHAAGTFWYHDHTMDATARNIEAGLAGFYIVEDELERSLALPKGDYDIPLILQTKRFTTAGKIVFNNGTPKDLLGDISLVNGVPSPRLEVANCKYRFRLLNASATRHYLLALSRSADRLTEDEVLTIISSDAGFLSKPVSLISPQQALPLAIAERYSAIIDFAKYPVGSSVYLHSISQGNLASTVSESASSQAIMKFKVVRTVVENSRIPDRLCSIEPLKITTKTPRRTFTFERGKNDRWLINQKEWDIDRIDANPKPGDTEIWTLINPNKDTFHPVHLHVAEAQLLDRNGRPPELFERGWKDVFLLGSEEKLRIAVRFKTGSDRDLVGKFMMHCHQLIHEDRGMMSQFEIGRGGLDPISTAPAQPISKIRPF